MSPKWPTSVRTIHRAGDPRRPAPAARPASRAEAPSHQPQSAPSLRERVGRLGRELSQEHATATAVLRLDQPIRNSCASPAAETPSVEAEPLKAEIAWPEVAMTMSVAAAELPGVSVQAPAASIGAELPSAKVDLPEAATEANLPTAPEVDGRRPGQHQGHRPQVCRPTFGCRDHLVRCARCCRSPAPGCAHRRPQVAAG